MNLYRLETDHMSGEQFHAIRGALTFSTDKVDITVAPGSQTEGSFTIYGASGLPAEGFVRSSAAAMHLSVTEFSGSLDVIPFIFDASAYLAGDVIEGFFRIISNQGEYRLPFTVHIAAEVIETTMGAVRSLTNFASLARVSWNEAVSAFYDPRFEGLFGPADKDLRSIWKGLSGKKGSEQQVEEFLIAIEKKVPAEFISEVKAIRTELQDEEVPVVEYYFRLTRNGWGYTHLTVETEGDFLSPVQEELSQKDFDGNVCEVHYLADRRKMHAGMNYGRVIITGPYTKIVIPVTVCASALREKTSLYRKETKGLTLKLMGLYEDFRGGKIKGREWLAQTEVLVDRLAALYPEDLTVLLYKTHIALSAGREKDAAWLLMNFDRKVETLLNIKPYSDPENRVLERQDPQLFSYRVYLGALCADENSAVTTYDAAQRVERALKREPGKWQIAWILLYISEKYRGDAIKKWELLRELCENGNASPVLYIEAYEIANANPSILSDLDGFTLRVLNYATRRGELSDAVLAQVNTLTQRRKTYSDMLFRILCRCYENRNLRKETLASICSLLIRGNLTGEVYFPWYEKGVKEQLNLTRLMEFYMLSLPENYQGEIPRFVLLYFCYSTALPYEKAAQLYEYVIRNREKQPSIFENYRNTIVEFTLRQLESRRITPSLCTLYAAVLSESNLTPANAAAAAEIIFTCCVKTEDVRYRGVVLRYDRTDTEYFYPLQNGSCTFPVYGEENRLFFEDNDGNRFAAGTSFTYERLISYDGLVPFLRKYDTGSLLFELYLADLAGRKAEGDDLERLRFLADSDELSEETRIEIMMRLLRSYRESESYPEMDSLLETCSEQSGLNAVVRGEILQYLVEREMLSKALGLLGRCGTYGVPASTLALLVEKLADRTGSEETMVPMLAYEAFKGGKASESIVRLLCERFEGMTVELNEIRDAAKDLRINTDRTEADESDENNLLKPGITLLDRMMTQMLYSGVILQNEEEVLAAYIAAGDNPGKATAVLAQLSHYAFVEDVPFSKMLYEEIGNFAVDGLPVFDVSRIAYLRNLSRKQGEIGGEELEIAKLFLAELLRQNIVFPFYRSFSGLLPELQAFADETMIQYKGRPGSSVLVHFSVDGETDIQPMREMYEGIYVAGFLLFFGEQVRYYITDDAEQKNVVESGTFSQDTRISASGSDRFSIINRISQLTAMERYDDALDEMESYNRRAHLVESLFSKKSE